MYFKISKKEFYEGLSTVSRAISNYSPLTKTKEMLDDMHKRKIDMADEIFVINVDGYIGESTKSEIEYAKLNGKVISYLENIEK